VTKLFLLIPIIFSNQSARSGSANRNVAPNPWGAENRQKESSLVIAPGAGEIRGRTGITLTGHGNRRDPGRSGARWS